MERIGVKWKQIVVVVVNPKLAAKRRKRLPTVTLTSTFTSSSFMKG